MPSVIAYVESSLASLLVGLSNKKRDGGTSRPPGSRAMKEERMRWVRANEGVRYARGDSSHLYSYSAMSLRPGRVMLLVIAHVSLAYS